MAGPVSRRGVWRLLDGVLVTMVGGLCIATVLAAAARIGWLTELATHFRPQYGFLGLLAGLLALAAGRRLAATAALGIAVVNLWIAWPYLAPWFATRTPLASGAPSVVSLNLHYRNTEYERVASYLQAVTPDLLVLAELTPDWSRALQPVLAGYPHALAASRRSPWGLGVYSRYPLREAFGTDLGVRGSFNVIATVDWLAGPVRLVAVHLASPTRPRFAQARNRQLEQLARILAASDPALPRLLVGDLNITPFSPYLRDFLARTGMHDARRSQGLHGTWPGWLLPLQIPIDHAIVDESLAATRVQRGPAVGSDHYPLEVHLVRAQAGRKSGGEHGK